MNIALDLRSLQPVPWPDIVAPTPGRGGHQLRARPLSPDQQLVRSSLREALLRILPELKPHPGLVASGTLTPECFLAGFGTSSGYFRFQHVFRPLDARSLNSKLHNALFEQCQVVLNDSHDTALDMAKWLLSRLGAHRSIGYSAAALPWHAESIAARGMGTEVFLEGIEVAQVNVISHMGGQRLERPLCLLAIGLRRIDVALRATASWLRSTPESSGNLLIHRLFELRASQANRACKHEMPALGDDCPALSIASQIARLGDIQTEMEFQYAVGTITSGYRRKMIQSLRQKYRALALLAIQRCSRRSPDVGHTYLPTWTLARLERLASSAVDTAPEHMISPKPTCQVLQNIVSEAQIGVPPASAWRTCAWTREEFATVLTCEWSQSPETMANFGKRVTTDAGSNAVRLQRLQRASEWLLHRLGRLDAQSKLLVEEYLRVMLIEAASFIRRAAPSVAALITVAHLRCWNASERTLQVANWRGAFWIDGKLEPASVAVLCVALAELADTLIVKLGRDGEHYTSCHDPWRLKRTSQLLVRVAAACDAEPPIVQDLLRCLGRELKVTRSVADQVFAQSYQRFAK